MDLNDKLAARRKELAEKAAEVTKITVEQKRIKEIPIRPSPQAKPIHTPPPPLPQDIPTMNEVTEQWTKGQHTFSGILIVVTVIGFFLSIWLGIALVVVLAIYGNSVNTGHEKRLLAERSVVD